MFSGGNDQAWKEPPQSLNTGMAKNITENPWPVPDSQYVI